MLDLVGGPDAGIHAHGVDRPGALLHLVCFVVTVLVLVLVNL
jgi:hypothetical protein